MLNSAEQRALAMKLLGLSENEVEKYSSIIEENHALYISIPEKGGDSLIVGQDGSVLYADSSVGYSLHIAEFNRGTRTPVEEFFNE